MSDANASAAVPETERADRAALEAAQWRRLEALLTRIHGTSAFYSRQLDATGIRRGDALHFPADLQRLPVTTKAELMADQEAHAPWGSVISEPILHYTRYHQTSGTTGRPLRWVDTPESWQWSLDCWKAVYRGARAGAGDRILFAFSFGPFYGFWAAFDAAAQMGAQCVPAGGMSSAQRVALIDALRPTVVCCTPTYALRLAEVARDECRLPLGGCGVRALIVAGEPGGSIPSTRQRIEKAWGARVIDHHGLTEVGPVSFECWENPGGLHVNEAEFIAEVVNPGDLRPVPDGTPGELLLTNLGRAANPVIRYRTGDLVVRESTPCPCGRTFARLVGGIRSRVDDMVVVRGVNIYPAAVEAIVRQFDPVVEFRSTVSRGGTMATLSIEIECAGQANLTAERLSEALQRSLGLHVPVTIAAPGTLPRPEMKSRRFVIQEKP